MLDVSQQFQTLPEQLAFDIVLLKTSFAKFAALQNFGPSSDGKTPKRGNLAKILFSIV